MTDIINIKTKSLNLINLIEISYGKLIEDTKDKHVFDKKIKLNIIKNIIPFFNSYFHIQPSIEIKTNLYYQNMICCHTFDQPKEIYQKKIKNYQVIQDSMIKEIYIHTINNILFPCLKTYDYQSIFILYTWNLGNGIYLKLYIFKSYGMIDISIDVNEKVSILNTRQVIINKRIEELSKIISYFKIN